MRCACADSAVQEPLRTAYTYCTIQMAHVVGLRSYMSPVCASCAAVESATSIAVLMSSTSSAVSRAWFGHSIRNWRMSSITWRKRSLAQREVIVSPKRVAA